MRAPDPGADPIIPQKPPPPPLRAPDGDESAPVPGAPADASPHRQSSHPASRRRKPSGHLVIPADAADVDPIIIDRAGARPRMGSSPLMLIDYPRLHRPSLTSGR